MRAILIALALTTSALADPMTTDQRVANLIGNLQIINAQQAAQIEQQVAQIADLKKQIEDLKKPEKPAEPK
jgi:cell division protein FtsB